MYKLKTLILYQINRQITSTFKNISKRSYMQTKPNHRTTWYLQLLPVILDSYDAGKSKHEIAAELNAADFKTLTGQTWTGDNVRKLWKRFYTSPKTPGFNYNAVAGNSKQALRTDVFKATLVLNSLDHVKAVQTRHRGFFITTGGVVYNAKGIKNHAYKLPMLTTDAQGRTKVLINNELVAVNELVASTYLVRPYASSWAINHISGDQADCRVSNLEYVGLSKNPLYLKIKANRGVNKHG